ncbi:MAG: Hsp20/alpha crystallin family protein [Syntrophales bacterium]|jgi:HSP20 family protein|nr:Hsp20/alpha crystallin family protein [Syntrophales bacterium]MDY0044334.1 Hsp20/alpha crystallin family protein [Syntrophales bacterium]
MDFIKIRVGEDLEMVDPELQGMLGGALRLFNPAITLKRVWHPLVDICESQDEIVVTAELAGIKEEDLAIQISRHILKISGKRQERTQSEKSRYHLAEIPYGYFERVLRLNAPIDIEGVTAHFTDGWLEIRIPKIPPEKRTRKISIQSL